MTYDQHIASDPAISAWVSASAGTGKTKLLTDRVLRLLLAGNLPSRILCITYTNAAAAEMESRIKAQLGRWTIADEEELCASLSELMDEAPDAKTLARARRLFAQVLTAPTGIRIQTIHGLCQSVLRRFPLEANVSPHFTLIDERTSQELLGEARMRLFTKSQKSDLRCSGAIAALATVLSESSLADLIKEIVSERRKFIPWFANPEGANILQDRIYETLGVGQGTEQSALISRHFQYSTEQLQALKQACGVLSECSGESDKATYAKLCKWLADQKDHEAYITAFITKLNEPRKLLHTKSAEKIWPQIKDVLLSEQQRVVAFADALQSLRVAQMSMYVIVLARTLLELYRDLKALHGYMDYDDLILRTAALLQASGTASWVLYKLDGGIDHLLVDEAQDTSPLQWDIISALAGEFFATENSKRSLFIVGDEKQSIYSFQGAEPRAFDEMQRRFSKNVSSTGAIFKRVRLSLSFRSVEPVLQVIDAVFAEADAREGLVFTEQDISHEVHRKGMAGRVDLWPLIEPAEDDTDYAPWYVAPKPQYVLSPQVQCAAQIADAIAIWLRDKRILPSQGRAVQPGDILILVQRRGTFARNMLRALKQRGIPVAGADRLVITEHIAVEDCIALAQFLLLPQDDLTLATVLKSPFIGLTEEELFELAYDRGKQSLWQRLKANNKFTAAHDFLAALLAKTDYLPPHELFVMMLETLGGRKKLMARLGAEIEDPLNEFLSLALQFEAIHPPSLQGFLHWLASGTTEIKRDMENARDEVRIMTVHGAKGLQAPVVFLPDTTRTPQYDSGILWLGREDAIPLWSPLSEYDDKHYRRHKEAARAETECEYRRLLYVAMTRAEDELYICGWKGSREVSPKCWYELIKRGVTNISPVSEELWSHSLEQTSQPKVKPRPTAETQIADLPNWTQVAPPAEPVTARPLTPSRIIPSDMSLGIKDSIARERGLLIHRLLQYLPDVALEKREETLKHFMQRYAARFTPAEARVVETEVMSILLHPEFAEVFGAHSVAEVPLSGIVTDNNGNKLVISGQIDRLAVSGDNVYIIDYKTNREMPASENAVPAGYLRQMDAYRRLITQIYPDKTVHCALLWTARPALMTLSHAILESLAA